MKARRWLCAEPGRRGPRPALLSTRFDSGVTPARLAIVTDQSGLPAGPYSGRVVVTYPFSFMVLQPVARLVVGNSSTTGGAITLTAGATMRNESQF